MAIAMEQPAKDSQGRFDHGSQLTLIFSAILICLSVGQVIYRLLLPTEGWSYSQGVTADDFQANTVIFTANLLGPPSPIQAGDRLIAVEGQSIDDVQSLLQPEFAGLWLREAPEAERGAKGI